ncbi:hypothetical protein C8J57DRAFT_1258023 [Mycena rebaudengoi]|nr:hypothetical protein C8J57DRAFT_1258023 [Mycena rebaudengoi]
MVFPAAQKQTLPDRDKNAPTNLPRRTPRSTAAASGTVISQFYAVGGPLDSQIESQAYISGLYHAAGQSIHIQSLPLSPVLSPKPEHVELDIPDIAINPVLSEADQLREEIQGLRERMDDERAQFFTSLEQANRERDKYREQAPRDWEQQALNAVAKLRQARDLVGAKPMPYHDNRGKQHEKIFFRACQTSTPLAEQRRRMAVPRDDSLPPSSPPVYVSPMASPICAPENRSFNNPFAPTISFWLQC